jgi:hypothetical protein
MRRIALILMAVSCFLSPLSAQSDIGRARIALFEPAGGKGDVALTAVLTTVADSVELSLAVLQRFEVRRLPPADPATDLARVKAYCQANRMDQAIMGSGSAKAGGGYLFKLVVYDRRSDSITLAPEGSSTGALDMFDVTDNLVGTLLDGLSGTHLLFGSLSVETDPAGATVLVNGKDVGTAPVSLRGLPAGAVQVSAKLARYEDVIASVTIVDGESTDAPVKLVRSTGTLALTVPTDAVVSVSSAEIGKKEITGSASATLPTGDYDVLASCPGMPQVIAKVTVARAASTPYVPWPKGYLDVQAMPAGATILVDGVERGVAPLIVDVDPGTQHHVVLRKDKYETYTADVSAAMGDKRILSTALVGLPGSITVETSIPGARTQLDTNRNGVTPAVFDNVQPGQHTLQITNIRVGNRLYTVGDPAQVNVGPGEATVVSKTFVEGRAILTIKDAPPGSVVQIDGNNVDSEKALTSGADVPAGWLDVAVQSPTSQKWTGSAFLTPGKADGLSIYSMTWEIPRRTITMKGNMDDWSGLVPVWTSFSSLSGWPDQPGTHPSRGFACRDDKNLYFRYDFSDGSPRAEISKDIKELDYLQLINTKAGEVMAIEKFMRSPSGAAQKTALGIHPERPGSSAWTNLGDNRISFHLGENAMEVAVPLELIKPYVKGAPAETAIFLMDTYGPGTTLNGMFKTHTIDFGF